MRPWVKHLLIFLGTVVVVAGVGTPAILKIYPSIIMRNLHRSVSSSLGHPIPDNTLYTYPKIVSPETAHGSPFLASGNQDGLYTFGWLSGTAATITLPDPKGRYQAVELVDPSTGVAVTLHGPSSTKIAGPRLVLGRTYAANSADLPAAVALARKITLTSVAK